MKKFENIEDILKKIRKRVIPSRKSLSSIDPKKMAKVAEDLEIAREINNLFKFRSLHNHPK